jgi:hypothetical protein
MDGAEIGLNHRGHREHGEGREGKKKRGGEEQKDRRS